MKEDYKAFESTDRLLFRVSVGCLMLLCLFLEFDFYQWIKAMLGLLFVGFLTAVLSGFLNLSDKARAFMYITSYVSLVVGIFLFTR